MSITKAELKRVKALSTRKGRQTSRQFLAEGIRLMEEALRHKFMPDRVYHAPSLLGLRGEELLRRMAEYKVVCTEISARELRGMAQTDTPQGVIGVFNLPENKSAELNSRGHRRVLWCDNIADPGNLGTLIRSALAFDFDPVVQTGNCADAFSPKVVRSSAGAVFGRRIIEMKSVEVLELARQYRITIIATAVRGKKLDYSLIKTFEKNKLILAIGSEAEGLSEEIIRSADLTLTIPHSRKVESLNAAVAGSILMNEFYSQREVS